MSPLYVDPDLPDCCYPCTGCGQTVCMDENPSPGESERICSTCYDNDPHSWEVPTRPGYLLNEGPAAKVRHQLADFRRSAEVVLSFASQRRDHIPTEVTDALARAVQAATEAQEAMTP